MPLPLHVALHIIFDMHSKKSIIPSLNSLTAFEAAARLQGFARAAEELNTSQPAISRHIRNLEIRYGTQLFHRDASPIRLTSKGNEFYANVVQGLDILEGAVRNLSRSDNRVTLVCSHSVSHLLLMPSYGRLRQQLGPEVELRIMTAEYNLTDAAVETGADIVFEYTNSLPTKDYAVLCKEEIKPVGTPQVIGQTLDALAGRAPPPTLLRLQKDNYGWMEWADWTAMHPGFASWTQTEEFDSYVYLLEAAVAGAGLALGWRRFVDPYIARGALVEMPMDWHSNATQIIARLTPFGRDNPTAHRCLDLLHQQV